MFIKIIYIDYVDLKNLMDAAELLLDAGHLVHQILCTEMALQFSHNMMV